MGEVSPMWKEHQDQDNGAILAHDGREFLIESVGRRPPRIFSPSKGKMGTRLKIAKLIFMIIRIGNTE